jgi:hypothetical protein
MELSSTSVPATFESLSLSEVELTCTGVGARKVGWHETPATARPEELWPGSAVRSAFLQLLAARAAEDATGRTLGKARSVRAAAIVSRACGGSARWLEFRRIYPTFWRAALDAETTETMVREMCALIEELELQASSAFGTPL